MIESWQQNTNLSNFIKMINNIIPSAFFIITLINVNQNVEPNYRHECVFGTDFP